MSIDTGCATHPALEAVVAMRSAVGSMLEASLWSLSDAELVELMRGQQDLVARLDAAVLAATREPTPGARRGSRARRRPRRGCGTGCWAARRRPSGG